MDGDSVQRHVAVVGDAHHQLAGVVEGHLADEALGNLGQDGDLRRKKFTLTKVPNSQTKNNLHSLTFISRTWRKAVASAPVNASWSFHWPR